MMKKLLAVLLSVVMLISVLPMGVISASAATDFSGYTPISSLAELDAVRNNMAGKYYLTRDLTFTAEDYQYGGAFYNGGAGWLPLGANSGGWYYYTDFTGVFDGNGHTITGLLVNMELSDNAVCAGLFAVVGEGGIVRNLGLINCGVTATATGEYDDAYAGSIAGGVEQGSIINCYNTVTKASSNYADTDLTVGQCYASSKDGTAYAGGIVGYQYDGTVEKCYNTNTVSANLEATSGSVYVGGVVGYATNYENETPAIIKNCHNIGSVTAKIDRSVYVGGIVSRISSVQIDGCYNVGDIYGKGNSVYAAGIVGYSNGDDSTVKNSYNAGTVKGTSDSIAYVGGVLGETYATAVTDCYNTETISASGAGSLYVGGVASEAGAVTRCYNLGKVSVKGTDSTCRASGIVASAYGKVTDCYNKGSITSSNSDDTGSAYAGGIATQVSSDVAISGCYNAATIKATATYAYACGISRSAESIKNCYNTASITATGKYGGYAGGVILAMFGGTVSKCYNTGKVSATASKSSGSSRASGVVLELSDSGKVENCYNTGAIKSTSDDPLAGGISAWMSKPKSVSYCYNVGSVNAKSSDWNTYAGGIVGYVNTPKITYCYNVGKITGTSTESYGRCVGGIVGYVSSETATISNCYYMSNTSGTNTYGTKRTAKQMATKSTFTKFDFSSKWTMKGRSDYPYPELCSIAMVKTPMDSSVGMNVTVSNTKKGVSVSWKADSAVTEYVVYRRVYSKSKWSSWTKYKTTTSTSYTDTKAKNGVRYQYKVLAKNGVTVGADTSSKIYRLKTTTAEASNATKSIKVSWTKNSSADKYYVYRSTYSKGKWSSYKKVKSTTSGSWSDTSVKNGVKYRYKVYSVKGDDKSGASSAVTVRRLSTPTTKAAKAGKGIKVSWTKNSSADKYYVYRSTYSKGKWSSYKKVKTASASAKSWTDTSAKKGVKYRYMVRTIKGDDRSYYKASSTVKR